MSIQKRVRVVDALSISPQPPLVVDHETSVAATVDRMRSADHECALVTRDGDLVGIFTERDVLNKVVGEPNTLTQCVSALMTLDPSCLTESDSIADAATRMHSGGYRHIPILNDAGMPIGLVRHKDMIAYLVENFADRTLNLPPDPDQIATKPDGA